MATTIHVPFTKVFYSSLNYDVEQISDWILGKSKSVFQQDARGASASCESFCGFYLPPFQRAEVWTKKRKIKLVESLFCEINVGTFVYVSNYDCPTVDGWLIDGQQRLTAIRDFVLGKFAVFDDQLRFDNMSEITLAFNGTDGLNQPKQANILWRRISLNFLRIEHVTDVEILKELYNRLNFGGVKHKKSERA